MPLNAEVRIYDNLFTKENPNDVDEGQEFTANFNPNSLEVVYACEAGAGVSTAEAGSALSV